MKVSALHEAHHPLYQLVLFAAYSGSCPPTMSARSPIFAASVICPEKRSCAVLWNENFKIRPQAAKKDVAKKNLVVVSGGAASMECGFCTLQLA